MINFRPRNLIDEGIAHHQKKEFNEAIFIYKKILSVNPRHFDALKLLGTAYAQTSNFKEALVTIDIAATIFSDDEKLLNNRGNILKELQRPDEALKSYDQAIKIKPDYAEAWFNRGVTLENLKHYDEALVSYEKAIALQSNYAEAIFNLAVMKLYRLDFIDGWIGYESRWRTKEFNSKPLSTSKPQWRGIKSERRLLIWAEQGIGDLILYGSMLNDFKNFPQKKIVSADAKLIPLLQRSFPSYQFIDKAELVPEDLYDEQIAIGSLGQFFRKEVADFKNATYPYLIDDPIKTQQLKSSPLFSNKKTCGVSWRSANQKLGKDKSVSLTDLLPILSASDMQLINLQYGDTAQEVANFQENHHLSIDSVPEIDIFNDIDGVLSIISACDLIITTSNSTAHLAGALGKETLLLTPYSVGKFWYWHDIDGVSLWYPSVKVFPQTTQGDWSAPINAMKDYLENGRSPHHA